MKHEWVEPTRIISWTYCRRCLIVKRMGAPESKCRGKAKLRSPKVSHRVKEALEEACAKAEGK